MTQKVFAPALAVSVLIRAGLRGRMIIADVTLAAAVLMRPTVAAASQRHGTTAAGLPEATPVEAEREA